LGRIMGSFLLLNIESYTLRLEASSKLTKIQKIIEFTKDIIQIKSNTRLVNKLAQYSPKLFGFEKCALIMFDDESSNNLDHESVIKVDQKIDELIYDDIHP
jgi:hypothetical protein